MRIKGGKKELIFLLYQGYDIAFDRIGENAAEYRTYTQGTYQNRRQASCDYYFRNTTCWDSIADAARGLEFIIEEIEEGWSQ